MFTHGIVLGHAISHNGIEVDKAKTDLIVNLPLPTSVKAIKSFFGHADFTIGSLKTLAKLLSL